jgi:hypothetical protein
MLPPLSVIVVAAAVPLRAVVPEVALIVPVPRFAPIVPPWSV